MNRIASNYETYILGKSLNKHILLVIENIFTFLIPYRNPTNDQKHNAQIHRFLSHYDDVI